MKYIIRLGDDGYYGKVAWGASPFQEATIFDSMKRARSQLNRIRDRFKMYPNATIIPWRGNAK